LRDDRRGHGRSLHRGLSTPSEEINQAEKAIRKFNVKGWSLRSVAGVAIAGVLDGDFLSNVKTLGAELFDRSGHPIVVATMILHAADRLARSNGKRGEALASLPPLCFALVMLVLVE